MVGVTNTIFLILLECCCWILGSSSNIAAVDIGNRQVEVSVTASSWPTVGTSPICEVWAYLQEESLEWIFLHNLLEKLKKTNDNNNDNSYYDHVIAAANQTYYHHHHEEEEEGRIYKNKINNPDTALYLLNYTLSLRAFSPTCELYRSLAQDLLIDSGLLDIDSTAAPPEALVLLYPGGILLNDVNYLSTAIQEIQKQQQQQQIQYPTQSFLLPGETAKSSPDNPYNITAVLYANVGTRAFQQWYDSITSSQISLILRHMGDVSTTSTTVNNKIGKTKTYLQGYGVSLDIRNIEYTVFDSKKEDDDTTILPTGGTNSAASSNHDNYLQLVLHSGEYIAGINLTKLLERSTSTSTGTDSPAATSASTNFFSLLTSSLLPIHHIQTKYESSVPKFMYEKRLLSLQMASAVVVPSSTTVTTIDPIFALRDISQNLPSRARYLQQLSVDHIREEVNYIWDHLPLLHSDSTVKNSPQHHHHHSAFHVFVNGHPILRIERPSFNMFEFINIIRQEQELLSSLTSNVHLPTFQAYQMLHRFIMGGEKALLSSYNRNPQDDNLQSLHADDPSSTSSSSSLLSTVRIDVGRGGSNAILYLNDIEQDTRYRSWSKSLQPLLFYGSYGPPTRVRRNLFTLLIVIDPLNSSTVSSSLVLLDLAARLLQGNVPLRVGLVIIKESDLLLQHDWEPPKSKPKIKEAAHTYQISELIYQLFHEFEQRGFFGVTLSFLLSWCQKIMMDNESQPTVQDLLEFYSDFVYENTHQYMDTNIDEIYDRSMAQLQKHSKYTEKYKSAVAFASSKGLLPGVSFWNGRPLPRLVEHLQSSFHRIMGEETEYLAEMMMRGELTEDKPRSLYAKLLTGKLVYSKYHPMLSQSKRVYGVAASITNRRMFLLGGSSRALLHVPIVIEGIFHLCDSSSSLIFNDLTLLHKLISMTQLPDLLSDLQPEEDGPNNKSRPAPSFHFQFIYDDEDSLCSHLSRFFEDLLKTVCDTPAKELLLLQNFAEVVRITSTYLSSGADLKKLFAAVKPAPLPSSSVAHLISILKPLRKALSGKNEVLPEQKRSIVSVNGRVLSPIDHATFSVEDVKILVQLEWERARALAFSLHQFYFSDNTPSPVDLSLDDALLKSFSWAVSDASRFLGQVASSDTGQSRIDVSTQVKNLIDSMTDPSSLIFSWNFDDRETAASKQSLEVEVTAVIDPLNKHVQRLMPILEAVRDKLHLPLRLVLAPTFDSSRDPLSLSSYYRFVAGTGNPDAVFSHLPKNHVLTMRLDVPEEWNVQQVAAIQDTDNLRCESTTNECGDFVASQSTCSLEETCSEPSLDHAARNVAKVEYGLLTLLFFGQCYDLDNGVPAAGLQLTLNKASFRIHGSRLITKYLSFPGQKIASVALADANQTAHFSESIVMHNLGYFQLRTLPGVWEVKIAEGSRGDKIFRIKINGISSSSSELTEAKIFVLKNFLTSSELLRVERKPGFETTPLVIDSDSGYTDALSVEGENGDDGLVHVFSLATGHLYERFLKIMMLSVTKRTSTKVKFWLFENFLSPSFKASAAAMAKDIGCEIEYVTYKWPEWLRGQSEKQRIIWGYKILFLDVLFPLKLKKIIYVDADQVVRGDLKELWDLDLQGAPYGYTPFCDSRNETIGYQFWRPSDSFWARHLRGRPYHISALYVVDLVTFRKQAVGDKLRSQYQTLSADPNSLSNLDQDLPNYAQHHVRIFSLPQEWLWCESWCSDETKAAAKTIDLCNNPRYKEPKLSMAKRIISGELFQESWIELDEEVRKYDVSF